MSKPTNKVLSLLVAAAMVLTLMPAFSLTASAAGVTSVTIDGVDATTNSVSGATWSGNTLTLNGPKTFGAIDISCDPTDAVTIVVNGAVTVTSSGIGIKSGGNLTVRGGGSTDELTINTKGHALDAYNNDNDIDIEIVGLTINASPSAGSNVVNCSGSFTMSSGTLNITVSGNGNGIYTDNDITIDGTATVQTTATTDDYVIIAGRDLYIGGSATVDVAAASDGAGIFAHNNVNISGGTVTTKGTGTSGAIECGTGGVSVTGGSLTVGDLDGTNGDVKCPLTVSNGTVTVNGNISGGLNVSGGTVNVTGTVNGTTNVTGGTVTAPSVTTITSITPTSGPEAGSTPVTLTGTNLTGAAVTVGGVAATNVTVVSATELTFATPAGTGTVDVVVTTSGGTATLKNGFTYHNHSHDLTTWAFDATNHWHACACGDKIDSAAHTEDSGVVTLPPTSSTAGTRTYSCTVCGRTLRTESIPATGGREDDRGDTGSDTGTTTTPPAKVTETTSDNWDTVTDILEDLEPGDTLTIDMQDKTELPAKVLEAVAGQDVDLTFDMGGGLAWTVNGKDIPQDVDFAALNLGISTGTDFIPAHLRNIDGSTDTVQLRLSHDGALPFTLTLTVTLDKVNVGYFANLFYHDPDVGALEFRGAVAVGDDGTVAFEFDHASDYLIVVSETIMKPVASVWQNPFTDVNEGDWFYGAVQYAHQNGLFAGTSETTFSPNMSMTRAMLVTVLWRLEGEPQAGANPFGDVAADAYYADAVAWAAEVGIVTGRGLLLSGPEPVPYFAPDSPVVREELATILYRYVQYKGGGFEGAWMFLLEFEDREAVSEWAYEAICWCTMNDVITGKPGNLLDPKGSATRAEVATVLHMLMEID